MLLTSARILVLLVLLPTLLHAAVVPRNVSNVKDGSIESLVAEWRERRTGQLRICISPWTPQVRCNASRDSSTYTGYQVEVFTAIARRIPWLRPEDYYFDCLGWEEMMTDLAAPNGTCFVAPSGIDVTMRNRKLGVQFSWPTYRSGFKILVHRDGQYKGGNAWTVFAAFHYSVWVMLVVTGLLVGGLLWFTDQPSRCVTKATWKAERDSCAQGKGYGGRTYSEDPRGTYSNRGPMLASVGEGHPTEAPIPVHPPKGFAGESLYSPHDDTFCEGDQRAVPGSYPPSYTQRMSDDSGSGPYRGAAAPGGGSRPELYRGSRASQCSSDDYYSEEPSDMEVGLGAALRRHSPGNRVPYSNGPESYYAGGEQGTDGESSYRKQLSRGKMIRGRLGLRKAQRRQAVRGVGDSAWAAVGGFVNMAAPPNTRTMPGRLILFFYGLLVLIMIQLFTANTASYFTSQSLKTLGSGKETLKDKLVLTWEEYTQKLRDQGIYAVGLPWDSDADEKVMLDMLRNGSAAALVQDKSLVENYAATDCEFVALPDAFYVWDLSFGYSSRMPRRVVEEINRVLLQAQDEDALFDRLQTAHINIPNTGEEATKSLGPTQITMTQVAGLWLMLAVGVGLSYALLGICYIGRFSRHIRAMASTALPLESHSGMSSGSSFATGSRHVSFNGVGGYRQQQYFPAAGGGGGGGMPGRARSFPGAVVGVPGSRGPPSLAVGGRGPTAPRNRSVDLQPHQRVPRGDQGWRAAPGGAYASEEQQQEQFAQYQDTASVSSSGDLDSSVSSPSRAAAAAPHYPPAASLLHTIGAQRGSSLAVEEKAPGEARVPGPEEARASSRAAVRTGALAFTGAGAGIGAVGAGVYAGAGWSGRAESGDVAPVGPSGNAVEMLRMHGGDDGDDDGDE